MKRNYEIYSELTELGKLLHILKDKNEVIQHIESAYPNIKDMWLIFKENKTIPLFDVIKLMGSCDGITTQSIENSLTYTGLICIESRDDVEELRKHNHTFSQIETLVHIEGIRSRSNVRFVKLCTPASALLVFLLGTNKESIELKSKLGIKLPSKLKPIATLGFLNKTILKSGLKQGAFYTQECASHIFTKDKELSPGIKKAKRLKDTELLVQPQSRHGSNNSCCKGKNMNILSNLYLYLDTLKSDFHMSESMANEKRGHIVELQKAIEEHERDSERLIESMDSIEKAIKVIEGMNSR